MNKSFLLLFFKKEAPAYLPSIRKRFFFEKKKQKLFSMNSCGARMSARTVRRVLCGGAGPR
jgi:hypothetical protein